jgi:hypothetical protein
MTVLLLLCVIYAESHKGASALCDLQHNCTQHYDSFVMLSVVILSIVALLLLFCQKRSRLQRV